MYLFSNIFNNSGLKWWLSKDVLRMVIDDRLTYDVFSYVFSYFLIFEGK